MIITKQYINSHRTPRGAFTKAQVEALGIKWPPRAGWINRVIGEVISTEQAKKFEGGKSQRAKKSKNDLEKACYTTMKQVDRLENDMLCSLYKAVVMEYDKRLVL